MSGFLAKFQPSPWLARKILLVAALVGVGVAAFCWGRSQSAVANPPAGNSPLGVQEFQGTSDYSRRIVAYLYGNSVITREELGEYLIARFGAERLEFMVNRRIVENEGRKLNLYVTDAEVEERFRRDLRAFGTAMTEQEFVNSILRRFNKTLYEWKEDVIRPKLMMEKIVRPMVRQALSDRDLIEGFEARYGPKVDCRMIVFAQNDTHMTESYNKAKMGRNEFLEVAKHQFIPNLGAIEGKVPPIHKHFGDLMLEEEAFRLKEGEVSALKQMKDGTWVMLLCEKRLPADLSKRFEDERLKLMGEMEELRLAQKIPEVFAKMREQAAPRLMLVPGPQRTAALQTVPPSSVPPDTSKPAPPPPVDSTPGPQPLVPSSVAPLALPSPPTPLASTPALDLTPPASTKDPAAPPMEPTKK